ncbi:hypothetical protein ACIBEA_22875 [Streptomyces sp. NPDC051555]|uniref:hypothetical protein n=1 Tax=Streptomyces sp. NPDC051555 TaxID=3365657 RepID=UPI0037A213B7
MSEAFPPSEQPEQPEQPGQPAAAPGGGGGVRRGVGRLVPRRRGARLAAVGAVVVLVGGGVAAAAVAEHHHERDGRALAVRAGSGHENGEGSGPGGRGGQDGHRAGGHGRAQQRGVGGWGHQGDGAPHGPGPRTAPAPLPALPLSQAADKAAAAVSGGKVESLRVIGQEGGGSAWLAVVIGPDGVRHGVTLSGTDGTVTGNTTTGVR